MPELPEVEVARRNLERWAAGRRVTRLQAAASRILEGTPARARRLLVGRRIEAARRRGKWILLVLEGDAGLLVHLGMTGRIERREGGAPAPAGSRMVASLDDGFVLHFVSRRLLGRLVPGALADLTGRPGWAELGPDPLEPGFDVSALRGALAGARGALKPALMDQKRLAGLGNIQAAEALWLARIHPARPAGDLERKDHARLLRGIRRTLQDTLAGLDPEEVAYLSDGSGIENPFRVYGRAGRPCPRCGSPIERIVLCGRSTFLCPVCQGP